MCYASPISKFKIARNVVLVNLRLIKMLNFHIHNYSLE